MVKDIINPEIKKDILSKEDFLRLQNTLKNLVTNTDIAFDEFGRKIFAPDILQEYAEKLLPLARDFFKSQTLLSSYSLFSEYSDKTISLTSHKDINACTYTIDLVVYQDRPWGLWIDGVEYIAEENEAIFFLGEDQQHWRETIENNESTIAVIFFHYTEPDHWYFTKGRDYIFEIYKMQAAKNNNGVM
jgi:hypothetical protein